MPAAFAIGERNGLSGQSVLRAVVLGYDICARVLLSFDEQVFRKSGHCASSFGQVFGAAAAAGALLGLDEQRIRYALAYAGEQAGGLSAMLRDSEHMEKAFGMGGMGARNGVAAALMSAYGFSGVDDIFSGEYDFFQTFAPTANRARLAHIPYKGNPLALVDLISGQVDIVVVALPSVSQYIQQSKVRGIVVLSPKRSASLPNLPTAAEAGQPQFVMENWYGFYGPAGLPREIVERLNTEAVKAIKQPDTRERLGSQGFDLFPSSPQELAMLMKSEYMRFGKIVKDAGIQPE